ncbi:hypothetical protein V1286_001184 [Bradyrhizobium algeriense]|jgi:hypothetical protein|uniref:DUF6894 domain-containing protein n=1 Tax=Bradyrhizobium algeriense TaxID=634784 RepID=A0ABU8B5A0_9BRAD
MKRYYFDLRDGDAVSVDEEGLELPDIEAVQEEAARSLVDMAKDAVRGRRFNGFGRGMEVEVRDEDGPVLQAKFTFEIDWKKQ